MTTTAHSGSEREATTARRRKYQSTGIIDKHDFSIMSWLGWRLGVPSDVPASSSSFGEYFQSIFALPHNTLSAFKRTDKDKCSKKEEHISNKKGGIPSNIVVFGLRQCANTAVTQARGLTKEFRSCGLPWKGDQCRSVISGGSGVLFCLPAFYCRSNRLEQCLWFTQALLSVMADYVYVGNESWIHGIDRIFATVNTIAMITRGAFGLKTITTTIAVIPLSAFILANRSKQQRDLQGWIFYHFLWHLTASIILAVVVHLLSTCGDDNKDFSNVDHSLLF
eukprot:CAMPEP_0168182742 /NCGR_PEP_ID=MMETSP0139_2-20121125/12057_1 /TAXON_ID=44445 /ORGANISM="Pseudo-nitzschia australis, Strain 10249 10 AB" /LENGTH=278 /DNA_ID=CAMNT_0008103695 /DNA_START=199 /DNA_END=1032 /DNA_ORIENTATION=-